MLSPDDFKKKAAKLYGTCRDRWRARLEKSLPKGVSLDLAPDQVLPFTQHEFTRWLWEQMGLQAVPCTYCRAPVDILSLQLDHRTPLRRGGGPELSNLNPKVCERCNKAKGEFTHEEYMEIVLLMDGPAAHFRQRLEGVLINGNMGNMLKNFPGKKKAAGKAKAVQGSLLNPAF